MRRVAIVFVFGALFLLSYPHEPSVPSARPQFSSQARVAALAPAPGPLPLLSAVKRQSGNSVGWLTVAGPAILGVVVLLLFASEVARARPVAEEVAAAPRHSSHAAPLPERPRPRGLSVHRDNIH